MAYAARNTETVVKNFVEEKSQLEKLQHALIGFIGDNETFTQSQNAAADATLNLANTIASGKVGTIDYYKKQITELEKLRDTTATSRSEVQVYDEKIADLKKSIDKLEGKRVVLEVISQKVDESIKQPELNLSANAQIKKDHEQIIDLYRQAQKAYVETDEEFKYLQQQIESREFAIKFTTNPTSLIQAGELIGGLQADVTHLTDGTIEMSAALQGVATGMGETFEALGNGITSAMGEATNGFDRFMKTLISGAVRLIAVFLSQSIAGAISGATQAAAQTGVAAPVTLPAFIAEMVGVVIGAFASIPKFETGGVVGGSSYYGDRILARLNSGELILNQRQQSNLWDMIQPAGSNVQVQIGGGFEIEGTKLRLVLDRTDKKQNRGG